MKTLFRLEHGSRALDHLSELVIVFWKLRLLRGSVTISAILRVVTYERKRQGSRKTRLIGV
jgi:hypothetical protein